MPATKTSKSKRNGKGRRRPWTKADHHELKAHSKKKNTGSQNFTSNEADGRGSPTTSFCPRTIFGAPPVTTSIPVVFETGSDPVRVCPHKSHRRAANRLSLSQETPFAALHESGDPEALGWANRFR